MLKGVHVTLMIGPGVPVPVPQEVLDALVSVKVISNTTGASGFELTFSISNRSPLQTIFLIGGSVPIPMVRVVIAVTVNGITDVLMDGVMTDHSIAPGTDAGHSTITIKGEDLTRVMDYIDFSGIPYPAMPVEARVLLILAKYAVLGIVPLVIPTLFFDVSLPIDKIPRQEGKDLAYIRSLAEKVGYVFYLDPGPQPGMSIAYWGPEVKVGVPQPALNINMDAYTNVDSLSFSLDESKKLLIVKIQNSLTKFPIPIPIPDVGILNPPLGLIPPIPKNVEELSGVSKLSPVQAVLFGLGQSSRSSDFVKGNGSLHVQRYGRVLKPRKLVGVRGAGAAFDGLHYVNSVTHNIKRGEYKQDFTLTRNGLLSTLPRVPA
ncbi:MAG TPA: hypothetical protein VIW26_02155 [Gemmatimonadales bacterium]|jgi:hypothetical protein